MALTPPDPKRCQAEVPNGHTFMSLGGRPGRVRCARTPVVVSTERGPGEDGEVGAMSLCLRCLSVLSKQEPLMWAAMYVVPIPEGE